MIVENLYTVIRFTVCYGMLCMLFPSLILHSYVKDKSLTWRIVFYQVAANVYITLICYLLAFIGIFYTWSLWGILVVAPAAIKIWTIRKKLRPEIFHKATSFSDIRSGFTGGKQLRRSAAGTVKQCLAKLYRGYIKGHIIQTAFWAVLLCIAMSVMGYYRLHNVGYAFTDEETHIYWIQSVIHNVAFPAGLYPHSMHFLVATITTMFGLPLARTYLCFSLFSMLLIFWTVYLFLSQIFRSAGAILAGMGFFLAADFFSINTCFRYQISVPMEFGQVAMFMMFIGLLDYIRTKDMRSLWMFGMGLFWSFHLHFYVTIFAAFICIGFGIVYLIPMIRKKILIKVIAGGTAAVLISLVPFVVGYVAGFSFERSISWGIEILQGGDGSKSLGQDTTETSDNTDENDSQDLIDEYTTDSSGSTGVTFSDETDTPDAADDDSIQAEPIKIWETGLVRSIVESDDVKSFDALIDRIAVHDAASAFLCAVRLTAYYMTTSMDASRVLLVLAALSVAYGAAGTLLSFLRKGKGLEYFLGHLAYAVSWMCAWGLYAMDLLEIQTVIGGYRACVFLALWSIGMLAVPVEIIFNILNLLPGKKWQNFLMYFCAAAVIAGVYHSGYARDVSEMYYEYAIQEADVRAVLKVMEEKEDSTWTFISPVNDLSILRYNGFHYEVVDLIREMEEGETEIYIPTPEIYVVVENQIPYYTTEQGETRMTDGSDFSKYSNPVDPEKASVLLKEYGIDELSSSDRAYYGYVRQPLMSKLYYWMEKIKEVYPSEVKTYYNDERCTVYCIKQDPYFLLNMAVDYSDKIEEALATNE